MSEKRNNKLIWLIPVSVNLFLIYCIVKAVFIDDESDTTGTFSVIMVAGILFYPKMSIRMLPFS